jgi:hypothetical protein
VSDVMPSLWPCCCVVVDEAPSEEVGEADSSLFPQPPSDKTPTTNAAPTNSSINLLFMAYPLLALPLAGLTLSTIYVGSHAPRLDANVREHLLEIVRK